MTKRLHILLRPTAFHEAGHAVAAYVLGRPIKHATIVPEQWKLGHVRLGGRHHAQRLETTTVGVQARFRLECDVIGAFAGPEAERRATGRANNVGARSDHGYAADVALALAGGDEKEANAYIRWVRRRAERLIEQYWTQVEAVAALLMERRTVTGT